MYCSLFSCLNAFNLCNVQLCEVGKLCTVHLCACVMFRCVRREVSVLFVWFRCAKDARWTAHWCVGGKLCTVLFSGVRVRQAVYLSGVKGSCVLFRSEKETSCVLFRSEQVTSCVLFRSEKVTSCVLFRS